MAQVIPKFHCRLFWYTNNTIAADIETWLNGLNISLSVVNTHSIGSTGCLVIARET